MTDVRTKPKASVISMEVHEEKPHAWWIGFLAIALVKVIKARTLPEAQAVARENLRTLALRFNDLPEVMRRDWLRISKERR